MPEDVANVHKKVTFETSDDGILTFSREGQFIASQPGECVLTVRSRQSPEITEQYHVLVTQPVRKVVITADAKDVAVGKTPAAWNDGYPRERHDSTGDLEFPESERRQQWTKTEL